MEDQLGLALVLMHRARSSLSTLQCTHWTWTHGERSAAALRRVGGTTIRGVALGGAPPPPEHERSTRLWYVAPDRGRTEHDHSVEITTEEGRWSIPRDPSSPALVRRPGWLDGGDQQRPDPLEDVRVLTDPALLAGLCELEEDGEEQVDGRPALRLLAVPRHDLGPPVSWYLDHELGGAGDLVLSVDREIGLLTRLELRVEGWAFQVEELRDVRVGEHVSAARFVPDVGRDREVLTPEQLHERLREEGRMRPALGPHHHEPTGPPPDDEAEATLAIQRALNSLIGPHERDVPGLEGGADLASTLRAARERSQAMVGEVSSFRLDHVRFLHARLADIRCSVVSGGRGSGLQFSGFAFEQDGEWLISRETLAGLVGLIGVRLPPRTVGLEPSG